MKLNSTYKGLVNKVSRIKRYKGGVSLDDMDMDSLRGRNRAAVKRGLNYLDVHRNAGSDGLSQ